MEHQEAVATLACERYLLDEMTEPERESFEAHFFDCTECAADVRSGAALRDGVRAGLVRDNSTTKRTFWRPATVLPWAMAASFALLAGYEAVRPRADLTIGAGPLALAPATLRPATRGQEAVVTPGPGGIVTLAVDLGGRRFDGGIQYELTRADGTRVASGRMAAPGTMSRASAGAPLLVIVPAGLLQTGERYVLTLQDPGNAALTGEQYRFSVGAP